MEDTAKMPLNDSGYLVDVKNLVKYFPVRKGIVIQRHVADVKAVDDVSSVSYTHLTLPTKA